MPQYSIIIPVYNRPAEISDLLESLSRQTYRDFETIIVEDGSTVRCDNEIDKYTGILDIKYFYKPNEGRSIARNYGIERSTGAILVFFDSDCVIPPDYFATLSQSLSRSPYDCFGGPDAAHDSFTATQKAINYAMTSFLTTGGIRGGKVSLEKFVPRTFNMGFTREVYNRVGGFREMFSEDIDMSTRIAEAGFSIRLITEAFVYHKRRVDFKKFLRQVHVFGMSRITLMQLYPGSLKFVHTLPAMAVVIGVMLVVLSLTLSPWFALPLGLYLLAIFIDALRVTRSLPIAVKAIPASVIQICGYGTGFIRAFTRDIIFGHGRDINREIEMRRGK